MLLDTGERCDGDDEKVKMHVVLLSPDKTHDNDIKVTSPPLIPLLRFDRNPQAQGVWGVLSKPLTIEFKDNCVSFEEIFGERFVRAMKVKIVEPGEGNPSDRLAVMLLLSYIVKSVKKGRERGSL